MSSPPLISDFDDRCGGSRRGFLFGVSAAAAFGLAGGARAAVAGPHLATYAAVIIAWKRHDVEEVLARMTDDIVWHVRVGLAPIVGKAAVRAMLTSMAAQRSAEHWRVFNACEHGAQLFVEGVDDFADGAGRRIALPYMGILEFAEGGRIKAWRDYFDAGDAAKMEAGGDVSSVIAPLISRPAMTLPSGGR